MVIANPGSFGNLDFAETNSRGTRFFLQTASRDSGWGTRKVKNVAPGVHGRNLKQKRDGFHVSIDGDVRVGARRQRTPKGARASRCAREHTCHRETSAEGTLEAWVGARAAADADGTSRNTASG